MTDLYMIRARLRHDIAGSDGALIRLLAESRFDADQTHKLVWTLFGDDPDRERDFVFRLERQYGRPMVLAYAPRPPRSDGALWHVDWKPFAPDLRHGDLLRFRVRVNPVRQSGNRRIDVVYDAVRERREEEGTQDIDRDTVAADVGATWFRERATRWGLDIGEESERPLAVTDYRNEPLRRGGMRLSTMEVEGIGRVTDPARLHEALRTGCGRAKAFGCGMLLIARARA